MPTYSAGTYVFIPDDEEVFKAAEVKSKFESGQPGAVQLISTSKELRLSKQETKDLIVMDKECLEPHADMVKMKNLDQASILQNLRLRFAQDEIYTNIGTILVAVNPFKQLPIYGPKQVDNYMTQGAQELPPHVYGVADNAYRNMVNFNNDQACIVSGESGAGKTETTKLFLQYIAEKSGGQSKQVEGTTLQEKILEANPIMEAFGNAKTVRNDNSSRFGKWIEVVFDQKGQIVRGNITQYLLEKSRVVQQAKNERNYHIFYQLCLAGALDPKTRKKYNLLDHGDYYFLNQAKEDGNSKVKNLGDGKSDSIDDKADWQATLQAMKVLGLDDKEVGAIIKTVSGILRIGNIQFKSAGEGKSKVEDSEAVKIASGLIGCDASALEKALINQAMTVAGDTVLKNNDVAKANDSRDTLAKAIYSYLFDWLITKINEALNKSKAKPKTTNTIGVLDIFGFEFFESNSFEQLCINFCNEKLQSHFNEHIFKLEQETYKKEGIKVDEIVFEDNQHVLDALQSRTGVFAMIDEEISLNGEDGTFLKKVLKKQDGKSILAPTAKQIRKKAELNLCFIVRHYAGEVEYNTTNFLDKNKDFLFPEMQALGLNSKEKFIKKIFVAKEEATGGASKGRGKRPTLGAQFKTQLNSLMGSLGKCEPHFVRCIKPNKKKEGGLFTATMVMDQLNYAGLLEVCRIRKNGYPVRKKHKEFMSRYKPFAKKPKKIEDFCAALQKSQKFTSRVRNKKGKMEDKEEKVKVLLEKEFQIGNTMVFMRTEQYNRLEQYLDSALFATAAKIQAFLRGAMQRKRYRLYTEILNEIEGAIKDRKEAPLEKALLRAGQLPFGGNFDSDKLDKKSKLRCVAAGRKLLGKLQEERKLIKLLNDAIKSNEESSIESALAAVIKANIKDKKTISKAEKSLKKLKETAAIRNALQEAISKESMSGLESGLKKASDNGMKAKDHPAVKDAETLLQQLKKIEKVEKDLEKALKAKNTGDVKKLMQQMVDLGRKESKLVKEAEEFTNTEAKASEARKADRKKVTKKLKAAIKENDLEALRDLEVKIIELGMDGDIVDEAKAKRKKLEESQDIATRLTAAKNTLTVKARSHDGITDSDVKELGKTISAAKKELSADDEDLNLAQEFLERMREQVAVQKKLEKALEATGDKRAKELKKALEQANALGLETGNAQKVAAEVRLLNNEEAEKNKEKDEKDRAKRIKRMENASAEEVAAAAKERLHKLASENHSKRIEECLDNSRYDLAKYYKIRTDEDFTEFDPASFKKQRATLKLWSRTKPIPKSILELDSDLNKIAIRINRAILQYCGDLSTSFPATLAHYILVSGLETPSLCDEIYIQLCKHVRGNTRKESADRGWLLMCMCTKTFPPSKEFELYLMNYLSNRQTAPGLIGNYARLSILQLDATIELGATWFKPNIDEIKCYRKRPPILAQIHMVDGSSEDFPVTPDLRVAQVLDMCRRHLKVEDDEKRPKWGIYVKDKDQEIELDPRERLFNFYHHYNKAKLVHLDLFLESWKGNEKELFQKLIEKYGPEPDAKQRSLKKDSKSKSSKGILSLPILSAKKAAKRLGFASESRDPPPSPQSPWPLPWWVHLGDVYLRMSNQNKDPTFIYKRRLFTSKTSDDDWLRKQLQDDFRTGELTIKKKEQAHELAALSLALDNGGKVPKTDKIVSYLPDHMPASFYENKEKDVAKAISSVKIPSGLDAQRKKYITLGKKSPVYGMCFFSVCRQDSDDVYTCGVNYKGVHILDSEHKEIIRTFSFKDIVKFGSTSEFLWMKVEEKGGEDKASRFPLSSKTGANMNVVLYTLQSWEIYDLLYDYTHME